MIPYTVLKTEKRKENCGKLFIVYFISFLLITIAYISIRYFGIYESISNVFNTNGIPSVVIRHTISPRVQISTQSPLSVGQNGYTSLSQSRQIELTSEEKANLSKLENLSDAWLEMFPLITKMKLEAERTGQTLELLSEQEKNDPLLDIPFPAVIGSSVQMITGKEFIALPASEFLQVSTQLYLSLRDNTDNDTDNQEFKQALQNQLHVNLASMESSEALIVSINEFQESESEEEIKLIHIGNFAFSAPSHMVTVSMANAICTNKKMNLLSIDSKTTATELRAVLLEEPLEQFWTSGIRKDDGKFYWKNGSLITSNFGDFQIIDLQETEDCLLLTAFFEQTALISSNCDQKHRFICH